MWECQVQVVEKKIPRCLWVTSLGGWLFVCKIWWFGLLSLRDMMSDSVVDGFNLTNHVFAQWGFLLRSWFRDADACCGSSTITKRNVSSAKSRILVSAYAALRPRDGFSHPHQEHMKDTYFLESTYNSQSKRTISSARSFQRNS